MSNVLFIHGGEKVKVDEKGNFYTDGSYNHEVWKRYKVLGNNLTVIFREDSKIYTQAEASLKFQMIDSDISVIITKNLKKNFASYFSISKELYNRRIIDNAIKDVDIIIARIPSDISYYAIRVALRLKKKLIVEVVGCPFDTMWNHSLRGKILAVPEYLKLRYILGKVPFVLYASESFLYNRYPTKGRYINCSDVSIDDLNKADLLDRINKIKSYKKDQKYVIATVGSVATKYKGQQYVIRAMRKLKDSGYNLEYWIIGGGDTSYLRNEVDKYKLSANVKFFGPLPHEAVIEIMRNIDIYVQPSDSESFGRVIVEAMSVACPCIGSTTGGIPDLIRKDFLFQRKSVNNLIEKISYLIDNDLFYDSANYSFKIAEKYQKDKLDVKRNIFFAEAIDSHE